MNNLNYVTIGVLGSVLALGACSNNPDATQMLNTSSVEYKQEKVEAAAKTVPSWFTTLPTDEKSIYSVGTAQSPDLQLSIDMATLNAKYTLADRINGKLKSLTQSWMAKLGQTDVDASVMTEIEKVSKNVIANVDVSGYNPTKVDVFPSGTQYRAFVLLEYSDKEAAKIIFNRMRKDRLVYSRLRSNEAWKELEAEVYKSEKKDEAQSLQNLEKVIKKNREVTNETPRT